MTSVVSVWTRILGLAWHSCVHNPPVSQCNKEQWDEEEPNPRPWDSNGRKNKNPCQPSAVTLIIFRWQLSSERNPFPVAVGIAEATPFAYSAD